jgi:hypothetical protein
MRWVRHVACIGEMRIAFRILVRRSEEESTLDKSRCRFEDNIKMDLKELFCEGVEWTDIIQDTNQYIKLFYY